jgi:hypothetical protein
MRTSISTIPESQCSTENVSNDSLSENKLAIDEQAVAEQIWQKIKLGTVDEKQKEL